MDDVVVVKPPCETEDLVAPTDSSARFRRKVTAY
jgi:hypothetical protein